MARLFEAVSEGTRAEGHRRSQRLLSMVRVRCCQHPPQYPACEDHPGFAQSSGDGVLHVLTHLEKWRCSGLFSRGNCARPSAAWRQVRRAASVPRHGVLPPTAEPLPGGFSKKTATHLLVRRVSSESV